jgi:hypothetical protein
MTIDKRPDVETDSCLAPLFGSDSRHAVALTPGPIGGLSHGGKLRPSDLIQTTRTGRALAAASWA